MTRSLYLYPCLVIESVFMFIMSKYFTVCPNYGLSFMGAIFTSVSFLEFVPNLTTNDKIVLLISLYTFYTFQNYNQHRNNVKSIS